MRATAALLTKEWREHGMAVLLLMIGCLALVSVMLVQVSASEFSLSIMEVVRLALLTAVPLFAFVLSNRLVTRDYVSRTRIFVEALPVRAGVPLLIKFTLGWLAVSMLVAGAIALTWYAAPPGDAIDWPFVQLVAIKSLTLGTLFWSIAFCFGLFGSLRLFLYLLLIGFCYFLANSPALDDDALAPFALIEADLFAFERDITPWRAIMQTLMIAAAFVFIGTFIAMFREGSLTERLSRPLTRRDLVVTSLALVAAYTTLSTLQKEWQSEPYVLSGEQVLRHGDLPIAVRFEHPDHERQAEATLGRLAEQVRLVQHHLAVVRVPAIRIWLDPNLDPHELQLWVDDGVILHANFSEYDFFENSILDTVTIHGVLQHLTNNRAVFEANHWVLDGLSHWFARQSLPAHQVVAHDNEVIARAYIALVRSPEPVDLVHNFQIVADTTGHLSAEALAYSALRFLARTQSENKIYELGRALAARPVGQNLVGVFQDRLNGSVRRFESITGLEWAQFMTRWRQWLTEQAMQPGIRAMIDLVPDVAGSIRSETDSNGVRWLLGQYRPRAVAQPTTRAGTCVLKYRRINAFDDEIWLNNDIRHEDPCTTDGIAHRVEHPFASGDRAYVVLQFEHPRWHWPVMLRSARVTFP